MIGTLVAPGVVGHLRSRLDAMGVQRVFLVTGTRSFEQSGAAEALAAQLSGLAVAHHRCREPSPTLDGAVAALDVFRAHHPDAIVACGGGTPIDTSKLVLAFAGTDATPRDVALGRAPVDHAPCPLVAIPTTAGTGSEVTHFAVCFVDGHKQSVASPALRPTLGLVDPDLTASMPPSITASTGLDALCQAIESHWSVRATDESRADSAAALALVPQHLAAAVHDPTPAVRLAMSQAATYAGRAIDRTFTTACHALAYHLSSEHGVHHGHAVALTLAPVLRFNARVTEADALVNVTVTRAAIADVVAALGARDADDAVLRFTALVAEVGLATRLSDVGCSTAADRAALVSAVNVQRLANNPRRIDAADLRQIVDEVA